MSLRARGAAKVSSNGPATSLSIPSAILSSTTTACAFVSEPLSGLAESPAAPASVAALQPADDLVVNAVDLGDEVLVGGLRSAVACLLYTSDAADDLTRV